MAILTNIDLPTDVDRVEQLKAKLAEYCARLEADRKSGSKMISDTTSKIIVLEALLKDGQVDLHAILQDAKTKEAGIAERFIRNAFEVIEDYCTSGGLNVSHGTGFPPATQSA